MSNVLKGKKILLISPQPWSEMWISKHHYAIELSKRGNKVYFLNPPTSSVKHGTCMITGEPVKNVFLINYRPLFPMRWKFKFNSLFNFFMQHQVEKINSCIGGRPDIVWDFEPNRQFSDLRWFGADIKIYHPVDATPEMNGSTKHADIIISVSDVILDYFKEAKIPRHFINHGLGAAFTKMALQRLQNIEQSRKNDKNNINFGYVGNLLMQYINHRLFEEVISTNPKINFHIWGPYDYSSMPYTEPNASQIANFIEFLKKSKNVVLYGRQSHAEILPKMVNLDGFFWCYDGSRDPNKGSNSHKILEYLSTGKVIVSTYISSYEKYKDLNIMVMSKSDDEYCNRFKEVVSNIETYNSTSLMISRMKLAIDNTYTSNLNHIESLLIQ